MTPACSNRAKARFIAVAVVLLSILGTEPAFAFASNCKAAVQQYQENLDQVVLDLTKYSKCIQRAAGNEDCAMEFRRLKSIQADFEVAVADRIRLCHGQ